MKKRYWIAIICAVLTLILTVAVSSADTGDENTGVSSATDSVESFLADSDSINVNTVKEQNMLGDDLWWTFENGKLTIGGSGAMPDTITYMPWSSVRGEITEIEIQDGVTTICESAFSGCSALRSVTIGNDVTSIGTYAFYCCTTLPSITIPDNVKSIGYYAFNTCLELTEIQLGSGVTSIGSWVFQNTEWWNSQNDGIVYLDYILIGVKERCDQTIYIKDGTRVIAAGAFFLNDEITEVFIPNSVAIIGSGAFDNCSEIEEIIIPDSVTTIENFAFSCCIKLKSLTLPDSVTYVGQGAFAQCTSLRSVQLSNSMTYISNTLFSGCSNLYSITIPSSVTSIGSQAFSECIMLTSISLDNGIESIGCEAFDDCISLKDVYYNGTKPYRLEKLSIYYENDFLTNAKWHYRRIDASVI